MKSFRKTPSSRRPRAAPAAGAPAGDGRDRKPRKQREYKDNGGDSAPRERKSNVEMLLDSLGPASNASEKPAAAADDKANKGKKKKKKD